MYELDLEKAKKILVEEEGYSVSDVDLTLNNFPALNDSLGRVVSQWLNDRSIEDFELGGLSVKQVMETRRMPFLEAIHSFNILMDDSISETERESIKRVLTSPVKLR